MFQETRYSISGIALSVGALSSRSSLKSGVSHDGIQLPEKAISCHRTTIKYGLSSQQHGKLGRRKECLESSFRKSFPKSPVNQRKDHRGLRIILKDRMYIYASQNKQLREI